MERFPITILSTIPSLKDALLEIQETNRICEFRLPNGDPFSVTGMTAQDCQNAFDSHCILLEKVKENGYEVVKKVYLCKGGLKYKDDEEAQNKKIKIYFGAVMVVIVIGLLVWYIQNKNKK